MFRCQECGRLFKTTRAAERAADKGCPGCGGVDIDLNSADQPDDPIPTGDSNYSVRDVDLAPGRLTVAEVQALLRRPIR